MKLIVFTPADMAHPKPRHFDRPLPVLLASILDGAVEEVPGFNTISDHSVVRKCCAYCNMNAKYDGSPINATATGLWHIALQRQGFERGLRQSDERIADWLTGDVVVVIIEG
jgi:hypothetical protein